MSADSPDEDTASIARAGLMASLRTERKEEFKKLARSPSGTLLKGFALLNALKSGVGPCEEWAGHDPFKGVNFFSSSPPSSSRILLFSQSCILIFVFSGYSSFHPLLYLLFSLLVSHSFLPPLPSFLPSFK